MPKGKWKQNDIFQEEIFTEKKYAVHEKQVKELYFQSNHSAKFVSVHTEKYVCKTFIWTSNSKFTNTETPSPILAFFLQI